MPYTSKLDEFEQFIQHAKLSILPMHALGTGTHQEHAAASQDLRQTPQAEHLLLIEDLPHCTDAQQRQKLIELLSKRLCSRDVVNAENLDRQPVIRQSAASCHGANILISHTQQLCSECQLHIVGHCRL